MDNSTLEETLVQLEGPSGLVMWEHFIFFTNAFVVPSVGVVGFVLNTLGIMTLVHMGVNTSAMVYMLLLCLGDTVSGFVDAILSVGLSAWKRDLYTINRWTCKVLKWINYGTTCSTQFILVLLTFDRVLAVVTPHKYRTLKQNLSYPLIASGVVIIVSHVLIGGNLYFFDLVNGVCSQGEYVSVIGGIVYFHYSTSFVYCGLPSALLIVFNAVILVYMRKNASQFKKAKSGREGAITRVLIMASMAFLVFTTAAMSLLYFGLFYLQPKIEQDPYYTVYVTGVLQLAELPSTMNVSFNFVFYLLGSNIFRNGFKSMLVQILRPRTIKKPREDTTTSNNVTAN